MVEILFTAEFKRRLKALSKRYRTVKNDIQPVLDKLQKGNFIGNQISGASIIAFKVRVKNSDIPTGKSGGYRLIYQTRSPDSIVLLTIYAKSDKSDVNIKELENAIKQFLQE
ncbi:MAG: type II toxin-antitoxin system RelE/ParE family toxin [Phormidesmis sp.]